VHILTKHLHNCQNTPIKTHPHITKQVKTTTAQDTHQMKLPSVWGHPNVHDTFVPKNFTSLHFTSLHFTSLHFTSLHFT